LAIAIFHAETDDVLHMIGGRVQASWQVARTVKEKNSLAVSMGDD
jgi:hypothetical protein